MLDQEDLKWIATTSTELNTTLQQISRYSDLARQSKGENNYIEMLSQRVELASKTAQSLFDRITSRILASSTGRTMPMADRNRPPSFTVVPPPTEISAPKKETVIAAAQLAAPAPVQLAEEKNPAPALGAGSDEIKILNPKGARELILLVEDEADVADVAAQMLTGEEYKVILARDGFEALRIYQQIGKEIGLVILDFFLPVMDGDAVFDELRELNPDVAVVLSSGFAEQSKLGNMLAQGLRGFIPKPYTRQKLLEQIRSTLDSPR